MTGRERSPPSDTSPTTSASIDDFPRSRAKSGLLMRMALILETVKDVL